MKNIKLLVENYLRKYPSPSKIQLIENSLLRLTYTHSTPYTDSKSQKQVYLPIQQIQAGSKIQNCSSTLAYDEKGRIQQVGTFDSIMVTEKHQKILQDDVFGKARLSQDKNRWLYVAKVKEEKPKSYFLKGSGKQVIEHDFGETYDGITNAKIFVWDKNLKQVYRVQTQNDLIPACPSFVNAQGNRIIFHAYKKTQFGHGLLHCFNRPIDIYQVSLDIQEQLQDAQKQAQIAKKKAQADKKALKNLKTIISDGNRTNIFASVSKCYKYLVYCSGQNKTHTHYLDLVVMERQGQNWKELHRIKDRLIGFYDTLKLFTAEQSGKPICYFQTYDTALQKIFKLEIQTGKVEQFSNGQKGQSYAISEILDSGSLLGTTTTHNYNTFFYTNSSSKANTIQYVQPANKENFIMEEFSQPIPAYYLQARKQNVLQEYQNRCDKMPLVVVAHGGPHGAVDPAFSLMRYTLLKMGYALLLPNFSGSTGFGQKYLEGALGNIGETDGNQIIALMQKLFKEKPFIDKQNVHVMGGSYGGFMGGILGSRYPEYFKSVVILNGVLSIAANLFFSDIPQWSTVQTLGKEQLHQLTEQDYNKMYQQSPISKPMKVPTLQLLGAKDRRVPYRQGLLFDAMTKRNGTPIQTYVYENSAHSLADSVETSIDVIMKSVLFLEGVLTDQKNKQQSKITQQEKEKEK